MLVYGLERCYMVWVLAGGVVSDKDGVNKQQRAM